MIIPIVLSVIILAGIAYLAISRRSTFKVRLAALAALAVMIITVIICLFRIFMTPAAGSKTPAYPDMPPPEAAAPPNIMGLVLFIIVLIGLFLGILILSLREQRRSAEKEDDDLKSKLGF
jgi:NADH:ubiquinone oxidoreductase subunit 5 (subunit L)/multisubunit Na+/H+ antiporter MnhA subunit